MGVEHVEYNKKTGELTFDWDRSTAREFAVAYQTGRAVLWMKEKFGSSGLPVTNTRIEWLLDRARVLESEEILKDEVGRAGKNFLRIASRNLSPLGDINVANFDDFARYNRRRR